MPDLGEVLLPTAAPLELVLRGTVTFLFLMALLRVVGQRESGGLGLTDLLLVVLVVDASSAGLRGDSSSLGDGVVLVLTLIFWSVVLDALAYRWPALGRFLKARPKALIHDGVLDRRVLRRELMTREEVMSQLRLHGIEDLSAVRRAYLEPNGMVSVLLAPGHGEAEEEPGRPSLDGT